MLGRDFSVLFIIYIYISIYIFFFFGGGRLGKNTKFLCLEMCVWFLVGGEVGVVFFWAWWMAEFLFFVLGGRGEVCFSMENIHVPQKDKTNPYGKNWCSNYLPSFLDNL